MKTKLLLAIAMLAATVAMAQEPMPAPPPPAHDGMMMRMPGPGFGGGRGMMGGGWWKNSELATKLKLTDQQKQALEKTFTDYRLQLIDQRAAVEREETKLQPLMDADQLDKGKVSAQLDALIAARTKLEKTSAMMHISMREILTPEQWKQLQSMHMRHRERGMDRRPDGPRPGGMRRSQPKAAPDAPTPPPQGPGGNEV